MEGTSLGSGAQEAEVVPVTAAPAGDMSSEGAPVQSGAPPGMSAAN